MNKDCPSCSAEMFLLNAGFSKNGFASILKTSFNNAVMVYYGKCSFCYELDKRPYESGSLPWKTFLQSQSEQGNISRSQPATGPSFRHRCRPHPPVQITGELQALLSQADCVLGSLDGSIQTLPNPELFVYMYVRKEAVLRHRKLPTPRERCCPTRRTPST